jgi:hypothetical protein
LKFIKYSQNWPKLFKINVLKKVGRGRSHDLFSN